MKRILFLIDDLFGGGAEKVLIDILGNLDTEKYEIDLFLIRNRGVYLDEIPNNVKLIYGYNDNKYIGSKFYKLFYNATRLQFKLSKVTSTKLISKKWIKNQYDVGIAFLEGSTTQMLSEMQNVKKKIAWIHTDLEKHNISKRDLEYKVLSCMNEIVCVSNSAKKALMKKHSNLNVRTSIITNPISISNIENKASDCKELALATQIMNDSEHKFVSIGRLEDVKGFDILLDSHKKLMDEGIKHKVYILGEGSKKNEILKKIDEYGVNDSFKLVGFKKNPYPYIKVADYFVMPSRYEGYPLSLCEAISLEKVIITTDFDSAYEILNNGELGLIVKKENIDELVKGMKVLIKDLNMQRNLKEKCRRGKVNFDFSEKIKEIENLLDC